MIEDDELARLRCTAALLSTTSTVSALLVHGDRVLLEVMRPPHPVRDHAVVPTCWFRSMVADLVAHGAPTDDAGRRRTQTLAAARVELGVRGGSALLPGHVLRIEAGTSWMHAVAVPADADAVRPLAVTAAHGADGVGDDQVLELHADRDLEVTVLALASDHADAASDAAADVLRTIAMRVAVERLEHELRVIADHPAGADTRRPR